MKSKSNGTTVNCIATGDALFISEGVFEFKAECILPGILQHEMLHIDKKNGIYEELIANYFGVFLFLDCLLDLQKLERIESLAIIEQTSASFFKLSTPFISQEPQHLLNYNSNRIGFRFDTIPMNIGDKGGFELFEDMVYGYYPQFLYENKITPDTYYEESGVAILRGKIHGMGICTLNNNCKGHDYSLRTWDLIKKQHHKVMGNKYSVLEEDFTLALCLMGLKAGSFYADFYAEYKAMNKFEKLNYLRFLAS